MKKFVCCLLAVLMIASLGACGGSKVPAAPTAPPAGTEAPITPAPTETPADPAPTEAPAQPATPAPSSPDYPKLIPMGETAHVDLNGDGREEAVCVSLKPQGDGMTLVQLSINGVDCSDALYADGAFFDCPDPDFWAITDVYSVDNLLEIAIQDWGPSSDYYTNFYRFESGEVYYFGGMQGLVWSESLRRGDVTFEEDGFVDTYLRFRVLQTWFGFVRYEIGNAGLLSLVPQPLYYATAPTSVTTLAPLSAYDAVDGKRYTVETGVNLTVLATDNNEWIYCEAPGSALPVWLHCSPESGFMLETPDGFAFSWEVLDGLLMAD